MKKLYRWIGPGKTLPFFALMFGLFTLVMAFVHTKGAAIAVRFSKLLPKPFASACLSKPTDLPRYGLTLTSIPLQCSVSQKGTA